MTAGTGPDPGELERRYRRLLRWYPRAYRTDRGTELVTTLLDTAEPGRRRPTRRDAVDLARGGLRQRFRLPLGIGVRVAAVAAALTLGATGAALGAWAAWSTSPGLPADTEARQIISAVMGVPYDGGLHRSAGAFDSLLPAPEHERPAYVANARSDDLAASTTDEVAGRLTAAGWSIRSMDGAPPPGHGGPELSAARGGLVVWVQWTRSPDEPAATFLSVDIVQAEPGLLPAGLLAGWLAGAVGGWLMVAATAYRIRRHGTAVRALAALFTTGALTALVLPTVVAYTAMQPFGRPHRFPAAPWTGYTRSPLEWLTLLAIAAAAAVLTLSVIPRAPARSGSWKAAGP